MGIHCECYIGDPRKLEEEIVSWCLYHATMRDEKAALESRVRELEAERDRLREAVECGIVYVEDNPRLGWYGVGIDRDHDKYDRQPLLEKLRAALKG